jgi:hypothetical protein
MVPTAEECMARIAELEKRVRDLEARPVFVPQPYWQPSPNLVPTPPFTWKCEPVPGRPGAVYCSSANLTGAAAPAPAHTYYGTARG